MDESPAWSQWESGGGYVFLQSASQPVSQHALAKPLTALPVSIGCGCVWWALLIASIGPAKLQEPQVASFVCYEPAGAGDSSRLHGEGQKYYTRSQLMDGDAATEVLVVAGEHAQASGAR